MLVYGCNDHGWSVGNGRNVCVCVCVCVLIMVGVYGGGGDYGRDVYGLWLDDRGMCVCVVI